ncbi:MAG: dihydrolipoamide acetyltransferase family protein [Sulfolobales archaeon]|nr:dihydrolipoamide acetyltransferase family protein [Sulfolobales archaeon]
MVVEVRMPKLGLTMTKGTVKKWLKSEGDRVSKGEPLFVIETEKISSTVEAPASGYLLKILAQVGSTLPVGAPVAYIGEFGEALPEVTPPLPVSEAAKPVEREAEAVSKPVTPTRVRATPRAKALAERERIDLTAIRGSGPGGLIVEEDVIKYLHEVRARTKSGLRVKEVIPLTSLRRTIAERMTESLRSMAQVTIMREEVVDALIKVKNELQQQIEKDTNIRLTYTPILVKVVAEAIKKFPIVNSTLEEDSIKVLDEINVGFAVAVDHGLVVPVVKDVDKKRLREIVVVCNDLARRAREGQLTMDDVSGGTFTITNLGMFGVDAFTPIINPPQTAILGVGRFIPKPVVIDDKVAVANTCVFSLTFDHRVMDGHTAAQFLNELINLIKDEHRLRAVLSE